MTVREENRVDPGEVNAKACARRSGVVSTSTRDPARYSLQVRSTGATAGLAASSTDTRHTRTHNGHAM